MEPYEPDVEVIEQILSLLNGKNYLEIEQIISEVKYRVAQDSCYVYD